MSAKTRCAWVYPNCQLSGTIQRRFKPDCLYTFAGLEGLLHLCYLDDGEYVEEDGEIDLVFDGAGKWCYDTFARNPEFVVFLREISPTWSGADFIALDN